MSLQALKHYSIKQQHVYGSSSADGDSLVSSPKATFQAPFSLDREWQKNDDIKPKRLVFATSRMGTQHNARIMQGSPHSSNLPGTQQNSRGMHEQGSSDSLGQSIQITFEIAAQQQQVHFPSLGRKESVTKTTVLQRSGMAKEKVIPMQGQTLVFPYVRV